MPGTISDYIPRVFAFRDERPNLTTANKIGEDQAKRSPEDPIIEQARKQEWEPLPLVAEVPGPIDYIKGCLSSYTSQYPAIKGLNQPNKKTHGLKQHLAVLSDAWDPEGTRETIGTGRDSIDYLLRGLFAAIDKHGYKSPGVARLLWGHTADGSTVCNQSYIVRHTSSGIRHADIGYCGDCHTTFKWSTHCDNLRCSNKGCADISADDKGRELGRLVLDTEAEMRTNCFRYHLIVSPPPEYSPSWIQDEAHYSELCKVVSDIARESLGASALTLVTHTHRGRKEHDEDEDREFLGLDPVGVPDSAYFWRIGPHFHGVMLCLSPRPFSFYKAVCREIYNATGFIVRLIPIKDTAEDVGNVYAYQLKHAGIPMRDGSSRYMQVAKRYGLFSRRLALRKVDLGYTIEQTKCPYDGNNLLIYGKATANTRHIKQFGHVSRMSEERVKAKVAEIMAEAPEEPYIDLAGRVHQHKILAFFIQEALGNVEGLYTDFSGDRLMYEDTPEEPDDYGDLPPIDIYDYDEDPPDGDGDTVHEDTGPSWWGPLYEFPRTSVGDGSP